jgi:hypothetical protein
LLLHACVRDSNRHFMDQMTSQEASERLGTHGRNLSAAIRKVEKVDSNLAAELGKEWYGLLEAMSEILEGMRKHLEH